MKTKSKKKQQANDDLVADILAGIIVISTTAYATGRLATWGWKKVFGSSKPQQPTINVITPEYHKSCIMTMRDEAIELQREIRSLISPDSKETRAKEMGLALGLKQSEMTKVETFDDIVNIYCDIHGLNKGVYVSVEFDTAEKIFEALLADVPASERKKRTKKVKA